MHYNNQSRVKKDFLPWFQTRISHFMRHSYSTGKKTVLRNCFIAWKTRIHLRPTRCWTQEAVYGSILIVFLAQLVISMLRYMHCIVTSLFRQNSSCKAFVISHLPLLLVKTGWENVFFSNFDWINRLIFCEKDLGWRGFFQPGFWLKTM